MAVFEKVLIGGSMVGVGGVAAYYLVKNFGLDSNEKNETYLKRIEILGKDNVKMLYSTMSFMYVEGYKKKEIDSFWTLYEILKLSKPNLVAIPLSEKEYNEKYAELALSKKFEDEMKRVEYFAKVRSDEITTLKDINVEDLGTLYPLYFCKKNKCKVVYADQPQEEYEKMFQAKLKLKELYQNKKSENLDLGVVESTTKEDMHKSDEEIEKDVFFNKREEFYVDSIMQQMNPKFSIIPQSMYKTIVAVAEPENLRGISQRWKTKFRTTYNHEVLEDEESEKRG